nr:putative integron gene cassette protein [uncultured bacterium]
MESTQASASQLVKAGMLRLCDDFTQLIAPLGFIRTRSDSRAWQRQQHGYVEQIYLHRSGSSYGASRNNSVAIRAQFSVRSLGDDQVAAPLYSDLLRDSSGHAYHLRFNALSWSTYDRCLTDLGRVTQEHGFPWFNRQRA